MPDLFSCCLGSATGFAGRTLYTSTPWTSCVKSHGSVAVLGALAARATAPSRPAACVVHADGSTQDLLPCLQPSSRIPSPSPNLRRSRSGSGRLAASAGAGVLPAALESARASGKPGTHRGSLYLKRGDASPCWLCLCCHACLAGGGSKTSEVSLVDELLALHAGAGEAGRLRRPAGAGLVRRSASGSTAAELSRGVASARAPVSARGTSTADARWGTLGDCAVGYALTSNAAELASAGASSHTWCQCKSVRSFHRRMSSVCNSQCRPPDRQANSTDLSVQRSTCPSVRQIVSICGWEAGNRWQLAGVWVGWSAAEHVSLLLSRQAGRLWGTLG